MNVAFSVLLEDYFMVGLHVRYKNGAGRLLMLGKGNGCTSLMYVTLERCLPRLGLESKGLRTIS